MSPKQKFTLSCLIVFMLAALVWAQQPVLIQQNGHQAIVTAGGAVTVDGSAVTQPISGNVGQASPPWSMQGPVASGGSNANNPVKVGGVFTTTQPTVTTGQIVDLQATNRGALIVGTGVDPFAVSGTVTANQGTANATPWNFNLSQVGGSSFALGQQLAAASLPVVLTAAQITTLTPLATVTANQGGAPWSFLGSLTQNGAAAAGNRVGTLPGLAETSYANGTALTQGRDQAVEVGTDGLLWTAQLPAIRPASFTASAKFAASSTTDNCVLPGNASNTVLVTEVRVSGIQTTAGVLNLELAKRSTADTVGTSASMTAVPDDSNYSAAVSAPLSYTGTGPTVGTLTGDIDNSEIGFMAAATAAPNDIYVGNFRQKPIVLRGTAQMIAVNLGGAVTGGTMTCTFKWIETATITP